MTAEATGRRAIRAIDSIVNTAVLVLLMLFLAFAGYALWDAEQVYKAAERSNYTIYKPTAENQGKSLKELQAINPEVIAWLTVFGTNIDYPVTQGHDNMKYINTDAEGRYSYTGSIFLDFKNSKDFSDFNSILYGHHMEKEAMFGEIGTFSKKDIFDSRKYGNLYFGEKDHGIEFFTFLHCDAYDSEVFNANVKESMRQVYLDGILEKAMLTRDIGVSVDDHIILLATCSAVSTNGRDILVGRITDEVYEDGFLTRSIEGGKEPLSVSGPAGFFENIPALLLWLVLILAALIALLSVIRHNKKMKQAEVKQIDQQGDELD